MYNRSILILIGVLGLFIGFVACQHKPFPVTPGTEVDSFGNYPPEIGRIFIKKCADGCHEPAHAIDNNNLSMDTWEHLFDGGSNGAVVVPYTPDFSSLMYFINTDPSRGLSLEPHMPYNKNPPYNRPPLSDSEYYTIRNWIAKGAPDKNGNIAFSTNAETRQKAYITMQGCNLLGVVDAEKKVIMRYLKIGQPDRDFSPHTVRVDPRGEYAYVCFSSNGQTLLKVNTTTDKEEGRIQLNPGGFGTPGYAWNAFHISDDGKQIAITNFASGNGGKLVLVNTENMTALQILEGLKYPHGIASNADFSIFYVTAQYSNAIYKVKYDKASGDVDTQHISLDGLPISFSTDTTKPAPNPHEILMSPDGSRLFVTCQGTNAVVVLDTKTDGIIQTIPVGQFPQEMAISQKLNHLFVTCMEAQSKEGLPFRGLVYEIDLSPPHAIVDVLSRKFAQPHGIAVDDINGVLYVGNRNATASGPAPHHTSDCGGGRNGFFQAFDLYTLEPVSVKNELTPDPYGLDIRRK